MRSLPTTALIVLEPLRNLHDEDENDPGGMKRVMDRLRLLRSLAGCTVLFNHHNAKPSTASRGRRAGEELRGTTVIHASVDVGIYLRGLKTDRKTYWQNKVEVEVREAAGAGDFSLRLDVKDDDNGEAIHAEWTISRDAVEQPADDEALNDEKMLEAVLADHQEGTHRIKQEWRKAGVLGDKSTREALGRLEAKALLVVNAVPNPKGGKKRQKYWPASTNGVRHQAGTSSQLAGDEVADERSE